MCKILTISRKGDTHIANEDFVFYDTHKNFVFGAVADGCSSGKNSQFASGLICYRFRDKIRLAISNEREIDLLKYKTILRFVLNSAKAFLNLEVLEILSTIICFVYDKDTKTLQILAIGDGSVCVDGVLTKIDQEGKPYYLGENLAEDVPENKYLFIKAVNPSHFVISTDGIDSFVTSTFSESNLDPQELLLKKHKDSIHLAQTYNKLKFNKIINNDDLTLLHANFTE